MSKKTKDGKNGQDAQTEKLGTRYGKPLERVTVQRRETFNNRYVEKTNQVLIKTQADRETRLLLGGIILLMVGLMVWDRPDIEFDTRLPYLGNLPWPVLVIGICLIGIISKGASSTIAGIFEAFSKKFGS